MKVEVNGRQFCLGRNRQQGDGDDGPRARRFRFIYGKCLQKGMSLGVDDSVLRKRREECYQVSDTPNRARERNRLVRHAQLSDHMHRAGKGPVLQLRC